MTGTPPTKTVTRRSFAAGAGAAGLLAATTPLDFARALRWRLTVGVLRPRSGAQPGSGEECKGGVEIARAICKERGRRERAITKANTETNVEVARARAEKLINDGAQLLVGAFDSGQTSAI